MYHYLKYRGFKSNRKADSQKADASKKKMLAKYNNVNAVLKEKNVYISEYIWKDFLSRSETNIGAKIHNSGDEFTFTVTRDMYEKEINAVLDNQIKLGVIDQRFKSDFLSIYKRQRDYSDGPSEQSKYHIKWGELVKKCTLDKDGNDCAPKDSYSAKEFVLLSALNNLQYKITPGENYRRIPIEKMPKILEAGLKTKTTKDKFFSYKDVFEIAGEKEPYMIKGLSLSKKERDKLLKDYLKKKQITNASYQLTEKENIDFDNVCTSKLLEKKFFTNSDLVYELLNNKSLDNKFKNRDSYDDIARILLVCKTDNKVEQEYKNFDKSGSVFDICQ